MNRKHQTIVACLRIALPSFDPEITKPPTAGCENSRQLTAPFATRNLIRAGKLVAFWRRPQIHPRALPHPLPALTPLMLPPLLTEAMELRLAVLTAKHKRQVVTATTNSMTKVLIIPQIVVCFFRWMHFAPLSDSALWQMFDQYLQPDGLIDGVHSGLPIWCFINNSLYNLSLQNKLVLFIFHHPGTNYHWQFLWILKILLFIFWHQLQWFNVDILNL